MHPSQSSVPYPWKTWTVFSLGAKKKMDYENVLGMAESWKQSVALISGSNVANFCGTTFHSVEEFNRAQNAAFKIVYVMQEDAGLVGAVEAKGARVLVVQEQNNLPRNVHGVGLLFPKFFGDKDDFYESVLAEHNFQSLKLGEKPGQAFRKGIYLTPVEPVSEDELRFRLLRCSTNLDGPTEGFRATDWEIVNALNENRDIFFPGSAECNHVLAQTYHNTIGDDGKPKKAKISVHSDKTKDMPAGGMLVFCTFYKGYRGGDFDKVHQFRRTDDGDYVWGRGGESVLTKLKWRLKGAAAEAFPNLKREFAVTLYPNSVFMVPLVTNRLYTHEISPSSLPIEHMPTRMGYVVRCSNTQAVWRNGKTYIITAPGEERELEPPTKAGVQELTQLYVLENASIDKVDYVNRFFFSMNSGDYLKPVAP